MVIMTGLDLFGNMDISASEEIWNFVSQFNLEGQIDCDQLSTGEIKNSTPHKELIQVIDVLGRKVVNHQNKNQILFYIYDDGSVEKLSNKRAIFSFILDFISLY